MYYELACLYFFYISTCYCHENDVNLVTQKLSSGFQMAIRYTVHVLVPICGLYFGGNVKNEPCHEKTVFLHMRKQRRRSTSW